MKILMISDSHGNKKGINKIFAEKSFDYLIFLGDGLSDLGDYKYLENVYYVAGNCDFFSSEPNERVVTIAGKKFFITHGNKYGVKGRLDYIKARGDELGVDFVCFGHTHSQCIESYNGKYLLNPGSFQKKSNDLSCGLQIEIGNDINISSFNV